MILFQRSRSFNLHSDDNFEQSIIDAGFDNKLDDYVLTQTYLESLD